MIDALARLTEDRAARDAARANFDAQLDIVKADLSAGGFGRRVTQKLGEEAREAFDYVIEVAEDNKSVVAGTVLALVLWFLRHPLIAGLTSLVGADDEETAEDDADRDD